MGKTEEERGKRKEGRTLFIAPKVNKARSKSAFFSWVPMCGPETQTFSKSVGSRGRAHLEQHRWHLERKILKEIQFVASLKSTESALSKMDFPFPRKS